MPVINTPVTPLGNKIDMPIGMFKHFSVGDHFRITGNTMLKRSSNTTVSMSDGSLWDYTTGVESHSLTRRYPIREVKVG